ncbi:mono [ADP-ribose] polymerase PARP16, partial [Brachionus plicatilis]
MSISIESKRRLIEDHMAKIFQEKNKSELLALDFEINLLICSAQSYKHESVLKPFPSTFLSDSTNSKNYDQLVKALLSLPPLLEWPTRIKKFNHDQLCVVYWILMHKNYHLSLCTSIDKEKIKESAKYVHDFASPSHIFEIKYSEEKNKKFDLLKQNTIEDLALEGAATSICFHGTRMDNLYSIMHMGLLSHLNKNGIFGDGTYLSQEPSISLHYSPSCKTWSSSLIGQRMSCLLVCETINHPRHVKIGINENALVEDKNGNSKTVPEKYLLVKNNEYVRVRYVLLYAEKTKKTVKNSRLIKFISDNKFLLLLF